MIKNKSFMEKQSKYYYTVQCKKMQQTTYLSVTELRQQSLGAVSMSRQSSLLILQNSSSLAYMVSPLTTDHVTVLQ